MTTIAEAIEEAAESGDDALGDRARSSQRRVGNVRNVILRFLQNLPEELTVMDLRQAIEDL